MSPERQERLIVAIERIGTGLIRLAGAAERALTALEPYRKQPVKP